MEAALSVPSPAGYVGTGVRVKDIQRVYDRFLDLQIHREMQLLGRWDAEKDSLERVEYIFNDFSGAGLSGVMDSFWQAWSDLSVNPEGEAERVALVSVSQNLVTTFNRMAGDLERMRREIDVSVAGTVSEINQITQQLANLNGEIVRAEVAGDSASGLRDQRFLLLQELSDKIGIQYFENEDGHISVSLANGLPLVEAKLSWNLATGVDPSNDSLLEVRWTDGQGAVVDVTDQISGGKLAGWINARDTHIPLYATRLDELAAGIIHEVNLLHLRGYGLDGTTGINFFNPLSVTTGAQQGNTGGAVIDAGSITDPFALTRDEYEIRFTGPATYDIYNVTDGVLVSSGAYASGSTIAFEGIQVVITDGAGGPAVDDVFTVSTTKGAAKNMSLNEDIVGDVEKIAAAQTADGLPGDNRNALAIYNLQSALVMGGGAFTFDGAYGALTAAVGTELQSAGNNQSYQQAVTDYAVNRRESISGVSLDEEAANLVKYQQAYTAAAKLISMVDELMDDLLNMV
jgi:flagellar hook-associated protein 1 FlgK